MEPSTPAATPVAKTAGLAIDPVLKRFLKGGIAAAIAAIITYSVTFLQQNPVALGASTALITAVLLAIEKSFGSNL